MSRLLSEQLSSDSHTDLECSQPQIVHPTNEIETLFDELYDQQLNYSFTETQTVKPLIDDFESAKTPELSVETIPLLPVVIPSVENHEVLQSPRLSEPVEQTTNVIEQSTLPKTSSDQTKKTKRQQAIAKLEKLVMPIKEESKNSDQDDLHISIEPTEFYYKRQIIPIDIDQLHSTSSFNHGAFGYVYAVTIEVPSRIKMAVKRIPCSTANVANEVTTMKMVGSGSCPYIVDYYCALIDRKKNELCICMEFMDASIEEFYRTMHSLDVLPFNMVETLMRRIAHNIISGLYYLAIKEIIHRDVKPANMLINNDVEIKLCDFGISRTFTEMKLDCDGIIGTANYLPPILQHTIQDDMWALGISLLEFICGENPFAKGGSYGKEITIYMWQPAVPTIVSDDIQELILHLLQKQMQNRPRSYDEILNKPAICNLTAMPSNKEYAFVRDVLDKNSRTRISN